MSGSQNSFNLAFGTSRGPTTHQLSAELIVARDEIGQLKDRLRDQQEVIEKMAAIHAGLQRTLDLRDSELEAADQSRNQALYELERMRYLMLWEPAVPDGPQLRNRLCPRPFTDDPVSLYQGDWSPRRPYLQTQIVSLGHDDHERPLHWEALTPIQPAHLMPLPTDGIPGPEGTGEYWSPYVPDDPVDFELGSARRDLLRDPFAKATCHDSDQLLERLTSTNGVRGQWIAEIQARQIFQPCPAHAYPTFKQWRNDLPYFRSIEDELRNHHGIDVGIYKPNKLIGSINIDPCIPKTSNADRLKAPPH